ncbi:MAG TPA: helix-turn-helix domain-containing protein, partial [Nevskiaceae bacterium]|nr:helix-turn-helix domain-containing protein [Nevskiaceae bacterium]
CGVNRTWTDIRRDSRQFVLLWFPVHGTVRIQQNRQREVVTAGEFAITYANRPLKIEVLPDENDRHESYQVAVPLHLMNPRVPHVEQLGGCRFPLERGNAMLSKKTWIALFEEAEGMTPKAIEAYVGAALDALAESLRGECRKRVDAFDIKNVRLNTLREYIDFHLSDPGLTASKVAHECGISARYVHLLFKEAGTTFRDLTWNRRLARAHEWLTSAQNADESISHIAFTAGFRSVSHFSRSFKAAFGVTPSQARAGRCVQPLVDPIMVSGTPTPH